MSLSTEEKTYLLNLARDAVDHAARGRALPAIDMDGVPGDLRHEGASFVTLNKHGRLRGCIGSLEARHPLVLDVQQNALGAALRDPRFPRVGPDEVEDLQVEVSVLSHPEPLHYDDAEDLHDKLRPGVDGVVVERGWQRATFLPQVWEKLTDEREFLQRLCLKAGLAPDAYAGGDLDVYTYQVEKFREE
jgi:AmmeMemoRadiSam system protein A